MFSNLGKDSSHLNVIFIMNLHFISEIYDYAHKFYLLVTLEFKYCFKISLIKKNFYSVLELDCFFKIVYFEYIYLWIESD